MLGALRLLLALFVVATHLSGRAFFAHFGVFAVFGFYVISGYLMTLILNDTYRSNSRAFFLNRFLRLFPIYYVIAITTLISINIIPNASEYHKAWLISYRTVDYLGNFLLLPFEFYNSSFRLVPSTWSIAVELVNYFLLWAIIARRWYLPVLFGVTASVYHATCLIFGEPWTALYYPFYAAILPFSIGSGLYFFQKRIKIEPSRFRVKIFVVITFVAFIANVYVDGMFAVEKPDYIKFFFYSNIIIVSALVFALIYVKESKYKKWDKFLGDLSYPVFLTHWLVGFYVSSILHPDVWSGPDIFWLTALISIIVSLILAHYTEKVVEPIRSRVRNMGSSDKGIIKVPKNKSGLVG